MRFNLTAAFLIVVSSIILLQSEVRAVAQPESTAYTARAPIATETSGKEDWTTISLAKSGLAIDAIDAVTLSKVEQPECTRELLRLQWRPGDPIDLYVIRPRGVAKPPVVLYLFDYTSDTDIFRKDSWCRQAKQDGIAVVGFVSALSGQRFHAPRPLSQWFVSQLQEALSTSTHDVQMILNYLNSRGDLDTKRIGMLGQGSGGSIAILAAAADPRIVALDVVDPWGDWPDWFKDSSRLPEQERKNYLRPEFLQKIANLDPVMYLPQLSSRKLRIQQLTDDSITSATARDKIASAVPESGEVIRYQDGPAQAKAWHTTGHAEWLADKLNPGENSSKRE